MRVLVTEINLSAKHGIHQTMIARGSVGPSRVWRRVAVVVDHGVSEICIGVKEFMCIGESPPQDHPHVYINMGEADSILYPYCATRFRFDPRLTPLDPPDSFFADHNAV
jgi:uncharacterized Zn-finger protein